jgi:hypothetical protein
MRPDASIKQPLAGLSSPVLGGRVLAWVPVGSSCVVVSDIVRP